MVRNEDQQWQNRAHFFAAAAEAMRRILIDRARKRQVRQSSGLATPEPFHESRIQARAPETELLALHEVLDQHGATVKKELQPLVEISGFNPRPALSHGATGRSPGNEPRL